MPSSTRVFKDLGLLDKLEEAKFPRKYGAAWTAATQGLYSHGFEGMQPDCDARIRFEEREQPGVDRNYTYHVDRGLFDLLLLQHAHELGAAVYEGIRVEGVDFDDGPYTTVKFTMGRKAMSTTCRMVVDASGRNTLLGKQLKLKVRDPVFDQYAIHTWFGDYDRGALARDGIGKDYIFIHFLPVSNTWLWQIPITEEITSLGVVTQKKNVAKAKEDREKFFWDTIATRPDILEPLRKAQRVRPFKDEGDYSYAMKQICGDRFVFIGDAARFVDPIFSTGVSIALNSARFASKDILGALEAGDFSKERFNTYESTIRRGTKNWYEFISVYYRLNVLFTYFVSNPAYRIDVIKLLQGDIYDEEAPEVLTKMRNMVAQIEQDKGHLWHSLLNDLTSKAFQPSF